MYTFPFLLFPQNMHPSLDPSKVLWQSQSHCTCKLESKVIFLLNRYIKLEAIILIKSNMLLTSRSNCDSSAANELRKHYRMPYFLPETSESSKTDWLFMGCPGYGAHLHVSTLTSIFLLERCILVYSVPVFKTKEVTQYINKCSWLLSTMRLFH